MSLKTIVGYVISFAVLSVVAALFIYTQPAAANGAEFCRTDPTAKQAQTACQYGYDNAPSIGRSTCDNSFGPTQQKERNACLEGYSYRLNTDEAARIANGEKCNVSGVGWVVCMVSKLIALIADGLFKVLEQLMRISPLDQSKEGGRELYKVWGMFRSIANVVFIIVLMVVIISHLTSAGISNYNLKRIMPRIIVGVLLINLSFVVCGLIVDITNIIGASLKAMLGSVAVPVKPQFSTWDSIVGVALVGIGAVSVYLSVFSIVPVIFSGIIALLMTVVILVARHAIIIALVAIAPLAFALNILPSTQSWFNKWWSSFIIIAMLYPAISFVFGATQVAAGVISLAAPSGSLGTLVFGTFALGVQSIPFFVTPLLIKLGGGLLNRFAGIVNNPSKGLIDRGRKGVQQWAANKTNTRETNALVGNSKGLHAAVTKRRNRTQQIARSHESQLSDANKGAFGRFATSDENREALARHVARNTGAGGLDGDAARAAAASRLMGEMSKVALDIKIDDVDAAEATLIDKNYTTKDLNDVIKNDVHKDGSSVTEDEKAAAIKRLASQSGNDEDTIHSLIDEVSRMQGNAQAIMALADGIDKSGVSGSAAHLGKSTTNTMRTQARQGSGIQDSNHTIANAVNRNAFNSDTLAHQSSGTIKKLVEAKDLLSSEAQANLRAQQGEVESSPKLRTKQSAQARRNMQGF